MARKILLADDSVTAQNMGRRILTDAGYEVVTVNNGSAALKKIAEHKPDLIVLDVYMPGYGGLEVCARLKENKETARIPVLLSVGKLEPFKAEEARRVRAEGYIVKPFEASELLTALTRLEDKIVPGPEPYKQGRFAKAIAAVEETDDGTDRFGDKESGWKDRLTIPKRSKKKGQSAEEKEVEVAEIRTFPRDAEPPVERPLERPIPAGLPADITPEEISAITSAAAALSKGEDTKAEPASSSPAEAVSENSNAQPVQQFSASAAVMPETAAESEPSAISDQSQPEPLASPNLAVTPEAAKPAASEENTAAEPKPTDAEVLAALAMLGAPGNDTESVAVGVAETAVGASYTGPRWIAEEVTPELEESTLILEREMEKTFAAMAAVEGARAPLAIEAAAAVEPSFVTENKAELSQMAVVAAPEPGQAETSEEQPVIPVEAIAMPDAAADVPVQVAEPPLADSIATAEIPTEVAEAPMAFAAAASGEASLPAAQASAEMASPAAESAAGAPEIRGQSELASAWANWRQIRDTVVGPSDSPAATEISPAEPVAESAPAQPEAAAQTPEAVPEAAEETAEASDGGEAEAISSIVDNMLAELKPKLMEELSKKLKKDKKK